MPRKKKDDVLKHARHDLSTKGRKVEKVKEAKAKKAAKLPSPKSPKIYNGNTMTSAQFFSKLRSGLRDAFRWWVPMQKALKLASRPSQSSNKRLKVEYQCNHCKEWFPRTEVQIDHIEECGSLKSYDDIVPFLKRLTAENIEDYQVLCKPCHKVKTMAYKEEQKTKLF